MVCIIFSYLWERHFLTPRKRWQLLYADDSETEGDPKDSDDRHINSGILAEEDVEKIQEEVLENEAAGRNYDSNYTDSDPELDMLLQTLIQNLTAMDKWVAWKKSSLLIFHFIQFFVD